MNGAIDAILYTHGNGSGTEAIRCGARLGKCKMNKIFKLQKNF